MKIKIRPDDARPVVRAMTRAARIVAGRGELTAVTGWHPGAGKRDR